MATRQEIEKLEQVLIDAEVAVKALTRLINEERKANGGGMEPDNYNHWGTVGVNTRVLAVRCTELGDAVGASPYLLYRKESK